MWARSYWPASYWAQDYWGNSGSLPIVKGGYPTAKPRRVESTGTQITVKLAVRVRPGRVTALPVPPEPRPPDTVESTGTIIAVRPQVHLARAMVTPVDEPAELFMLGLT